jgi:nucleoid-associated protein YgaU
VLTLSQEVDGTIILSKEEILLAPLAPPIPPEPAQVEVPVVAALEQAQRGAARVASTIPQVAEIAQAAPPPEPAAPQPQNVTQPAPAQPAQSQAVSTRPTAQGGAGQTPRPAPPDKVAILRATAEGVQLVEPIAPAPQAMKNIVLDTISYSDQGDVELAGRAQDQTAEVRVYLNNRAITNLSVDAAGNWRGALPDVDEGIYTLRVDEVTAAGTVSSRVETPFKREAPAVLAAASAGEGPLKAITVQAGATLWAIARDRYGDGTLYLRVFEANASAIRDPDLIYPGQVFDLPE